MPTGFRINQGKNQVYFSLRFGCLDLPLAASCCSAGPARFVGCSLMSHNKLHLIRFFGKGTKWWYIKACHLYTEREIAVPSLRNRKKISGGVLVSGVECVEGCCVSKRATVVLRNRPGP